MGALSSSDQFHLRAALGWLELGNPAEAEAELRQLAGDVRNDPEVLELRWHIEAAAKNWEACVEIGETLVRVAPDRPNAWIHRSFALHELKRTQEAFDRLLPVAARWPQLWVIPYNLACYTTQLGRLEEGARWLKQAAALDEARVRREAASDPDLAPLLRGAEPDQSSTQG